MGNWIRTSSPLTVGKTKTKSNNAEANRNFILQNNQVDSKSILQFLNICDGSCQKRLFNGQTEHQGGKLNHL